jgi:hypothetical protein
MAASPKTFVNGMNALLGSGVHVCAESLAATLHAI